MQLPISESASGRLRPIPELTHLRAILQGWLWKHEWQAAFDHENRKTPISKPAENAQRPNVQAETRRARLRRSASCQIIS